MPFGRSSAYLLSWQTLSVQSGQQPRLAIMRGFMMKRCVRARTHFMDLAKAFYPAYVVAC